MSWRRWASKALNEAASHSRLAAHSEAGIRSWHKARARLWLDRAIHERVTANPTMTATGWSYALDGNTRMRRLLRELGGHRGTLSVASGCDGRNLHVHVLTDAGRTAADVEAAICARHAAERRAA